MYVHKYVQMSMSMYICTYSILALLSKPVGFTLETVCDGVANYIRTYALMYIYIRMHTPTCCIFIGTYYCFLDQIICTCVHTYVRTYVYVCVLSCII